MSLGSEKRGNSQQFSKKNGLYFASIRSVYKIYNQSIHIKLLDTGNDVDDVPFHLGWLFES
jgi:hypothetical protein